MNYHLIERIGEGQYGVVYKAVHKETFQVYACKKMNLKLMQDKGCIEDLQNEIINLNKVDHPNIVKLVQEFKTINHHYLFFDYCNGGTLSDVKDITETLSEGVVRSIGI
jgi:5'-AMP-activated protein kinase, catalytic alpha subunit